VSDPHHFFFASRDAAFESGQHIAGKSKSAAGIGTVRVNRDKKDNRNRKRDAKNRAPIRVNARRRSARAAKGSTSMSITASPRAIALSLPVDSILSEFPCRAT
jgi:hypothetical protein